MILNFYMQVHGKKEIETCFFYIAMVRFAQSSPNGLTDAISCVGNRLEGKIRAFPTICKVFNTFFIFVLFSVSLFLCVISLSATSL